MTGEFQAEPPSGNQGGRAFCPQCRGEMAQLDIVCPHCGFDFPGMDVKPRGTPFVHQRWADFVLVIGQVVAVLICLVSAAAAIMSTMVYIGIGPCETMCLFFLSLALFVVFGRARDIRPR
jgi:hypothetical protein